MGGGGVLDEVVERGGLDGLAVQPQLLRHNLRHRQGMDDIGLPALALLVLVGLCRKFKGRPDVLEVCRRIVAPDSLFQVLILFLNGHDTTPPLLPAASSRRRDR